MPPRKKKKKDRRPDQNEWSTITGAMRDDGRRNPPGGGNPRPLPVATPPASQVIVVDDDDDDDDDGVTVLNEPMDLVQLEEDPRFEQDLRDPLPGFPRMPLSRQAMQQHQQQPHPRFRQQQQQQPHPHFPQQQQQPHPHFPQQQQQPHPPFPQQQRPCPLFSQRQQPRPLFPQQQQPRPLFLQQQRPPLPQQQRPHFPQEQNQARPVPLIPQVQVRHGPSPTVPSQVQPTGAPIVVCGQMAQSGGACQQMLVPIHPHSPRIPVPQCNRVLVPETSRVLLPHPNRVLVPQPNRVLLPQSSNRVLLPGPVSPNSNPIPTYPSQHIILGTNPVPFPSNSHSSRSDDVNDCMSNLGSLESFPNGSVEAARESILPAHEAFRPGMDAVSAMKSSQKPHGKMDSDRGSIIVRVNSEVEDCIRKLSTKGKFVPEFTVKKIVEDLLRRNRYPWGTAPIRWFEVSSANDFSKLHGRTIELIKVYCQNTPISTLHDLEAAIAQVEKVSDYEELCMGPIIKHPTVKDLFKPPDDLNKPPEITLFDLYKYIMRMTERKRDRNAVRFTLEDYLEFVRKKEGLESIQHLCIRVRSFPLMLQIKSKYGGMMRQRQKEMDSKLEEELQSVLAHETSLLKRKFSDPRNDDPLSIMRDLARKDPIMILSTMFETCLQYIGPYHRGRLNEFIQYFLRNKSLRDIFLLAIYKGAYSADKLFPKFFEEPSASSSVYVEGGGASMMMATHSQAMYKPEAELVVQVHRLLRDLPAPISLPTLADLEKHVTDNCGAADFSSMGCGSFLSLVTSHQELLSQLDGGVLGSQVQGVEARKAKMLGVVDQLAIEKKSNEAVVENAVVMQFHVGNFQELGCGLPQKLISEYTGLQASGGLPRGNSLTYLSPLIVNSQSVVSAGNLGFGGVGEAHSVGILGHKSRADAVKCLKAAPLLEDLWEWSHWSALFEPQLGPLPDFLRSLDSGSEYDGSLVSALEVPPGKLLKIDRTSSIQAFNSAVDVLDHVGVAGHLVSVVALRGNTRDISPQLLSGQVTSVLQKAMAGGVASCGGEKAEREGVVIEFVLKSLQRIPLALCKLVAREIFLDPLCKVTSSSVMEDMISLCATAGQRRFLQELGMCIGVRKWADDVSRMWEEPGVKRREKEDGVLGGAEMEYSMDLDSPEATVDSNLPSNQPDLIPRLPIPQASGAEYADDSLPDAAECETGTAAIPSPVPVQLSEEDLAERDGQCYDVVQSIRHEEFGIGVELDVEQQRVASKQREREGRGIKRLSLELYSKDTHFVLELIQNADDNSYPPSLVKGEVGRQKGDILSVPSLKFIVRKKEIVVLNNEVGFIEKNVRAICDVGRSTKSASRSGYIGQKGIGFKSVFRITNMPAIHSKGFHIRFDASSDPIGFILPHWFTQGESEQAKNMEWNAWTTRIELPFKEELVSKDMAKKFDDVQPSLLLFLHRLRSISVEDEVCDHVRCMYREDLGHGIIEIKHGDAVSSRTDRWLVVKKVLGDASKYKPEVEATELALAFPLPQDASKPRQSKDLQQQQVFAFLPLRSYGFRFIVQGDFDLPSSRECVTSDSPWNQWLREQVPGLFLQALQDMRKHFCRVDKVSEVEAVALFLQFVPLEGEVLDFFQPLTSQILNLIRGTKCLPTEPCVHDMTVTFSSLISSSTSSIQMEARGGARLSEMEWKQPSQCLYVREEFVHDHIPQELLVEALNLHYLHPSVLDSLNHSLRNQLGIKSLNVDHLKEVARVLLRYYQSSGDKMEVDELDDDIMLLDEDYDDDDDVQIVGITKPSSKSSGTREVMVEWITCWLACLHIVIEESSALARTDLLEKVKDLKILPLEDGSFVAANNEGTIFFPPDFKRGDMDANSDNFEDIYQEMRVLDLSLFDKGDDFTQSRVRKILGLLGVKSLYPAHIVRHHILPRFQIVTNGRILMRYLQYYKEYCGRRDSGINESEIIPMLKTCVVLVTNRGLKTPDTEVIHFSSEYLSQRDDLVQMFPDVKWTAVSSIYLKHPAGLEEKSSWVRLFELLGVKKYFVVEKVTEELQKDSQEWFELRNSVMKRLPDTSYILRDYRSPEVEKIVASVRGMTVDDQRQKMKALAELLDDRWEKQHQNEMEALIYDSYNKEYLEAKTASSFSKFLVHQPWLPPKYIGGEKACSSQTTCSPQALFVGSKLFYDRSERVRSLLHVHVPYIDAELKSSDFRKHLKIQDVISKKDLLDHLVAWSTSSQEEEGGFFETSIEHMSSVYEYLLGETRGFRHRELDTEAESIREAFTDDEIPLIFVPSGYSKEEPKSRTSRNVMGEFLSIHSVCWMDPTTVLHEYQKFNWNLPRNFPKILSLHYDYSETLKGIFEGMNVRVTPTITSMISLLKFNSSLSVHPDINTVRNFTSVLLYLVEACQEQHLKESYLRENLRNDKMFPSSKQVWVSPDDSCLLENDDTVLAKYFVDMEKVHFLQWPPRMASERKGGRHHPQYSYNEEKKESVLKVLQISSLSANVCVKTDFGMISAAAEEIKERLSLYTSLIQRFLFMNCPIQYHTLEQLDIVSKLKNLQVFVATELKCIHYIEYEEERFMSPKSKTEACVLDYGEEDKPIIYVAGKKKDKPPIYLKDPILKLFMRDQSDADEKDVFSTFLGSLFGDLPSTSEEIDEIIENENLPELDDDVEKWVIPLPLKHQMSKEKSVEEDFNEPMVQSDETVTVSASGTTSMSALEPDTSEPKALTSWPPRAAVERGSYGGATNSQSTFNIPVISKSNSSDVIGKDEVREVMKDYIEDEEDTEKGKRFYQGALATAVKDSEIKDYQRNRDENVRHGPIQHSGDSRDTAPSGGITRENKGEVAHAGEGIRPPQASPEHDFSHEGEGQEKSRTRSQLEQPVNQTNKSPSWQASVSPRKDMYPPGGASLVDIQDFVDQVGQRTTLPSTIELVENEKDEESLLKISRWGEEYVYSVLLARGELPNGNKIVGLKWVNQENESGRPYDIEVVVREDKDNGVELMEEMGAEAEQMEGIEDNSSIRTIFIEVKSTAAKEKSVFEISLNEIKFAEKKHRDYHLYRVYNAGLQSSRLFQLENLHLYLKQNSAKLMFII